MKKIKLILLLLFFTVFINKDIYPNVTNKIIAKIDNQIISSFELKNKIKMILFFSKQEINQSNVDKVKTIALRALVNSKLKENEIINRNISIENNLKLVNYLKSIYANFNTNEEGFKRLFIQNDIDFDLYLNEVKHEMAWQNLIYRIYKDKVVVNEKEIIDELNNFIQSQRNLEKFELAEIIILGVNESENKKNIEEVLNQIQIEGFNDTAIKFSQSSTAFNGGNIGWVNSKSLSKDILSIVKNLKVGEVSKPFFQTNSIVFLKLINKKRENINDINIETVKSNIITAKSNELLNIFSNNHLSKIKNKAFIKYNE